MSTPHHTIPVTILICDDNADDRLRTRQALDVAHVVNRLRFVEDGEQLLDYLYQRGRYAGETGKAPRPGLILLDLRMLKLGGREALRAIKGDPSLADIPVVALTTSEGDEGIVRGYKLGVNAFIRKPVTFAGLVDAMHGLGRYWLEIVELAPVPAQAWREARATG